MDVMRTISSYLGVLEPETKENDQISISLRFFGIWAPSLFYWYHFSHFGEKLEVNPNPNDSIAMNFLRLLHRKPKDFILDPLHVKAFDQSLILYAEHDYNASTFASLVTTATRSDIYSALTTAIGTLKGPLHGGANEWAMLFLENIESKE